MSLAAIRSAIATSLDGIAGVRSTTYLTDQVSPPAGGGFAMTEFDSIEYDLTFGRGLDSYPLVVTVFAPRESERATQTFLDTLRDPHAATSIKTVLEGDAGIATAIGGNGYLKIARALRPTIVKIGEIDYLALEFQGEVVL